MSTSTPVSGSSGGPPPLHQAIVALLAAAFLVFPYLFSSQVREADALGSELVGDGLALVTQHPVLRAVQEDGAQLASTLTSSWWEGVHDNQRLYRPLSTLLLGVAGAAAGPYDEAAPAKAPFPYHFLVVLLNVGCALAVLQLATTLLGNARMALVAASLFAVLPVHGEVLYDVANVAELLWTVLGLAAWGAWLQAGDAPLRRPTRLAACLALLFLATLAKEGAFALPLVFFVMDIGRSKEGGIGAGVRHALSKWPALAACGVVLLLSLALRYAVEGQIFPQYVADNRLDNPLIFESGLTQLMNAARVLGASLLILVGINPLIGGVGFSPDYSFDQIPVLPAFAWQNLLGLAGVLAVAGLAIALYRKCRTRSALLLVLLASTLLTSNLFFDVGTIFGERLLFFPSVALVLIVGATLGRLGTPGVGLGLAASLVCGLLLNLGIDGCLGAKAGRATDWSSQSNLWSHAVDVAPRSAKARFNSAAALVRDNITPLAKTELEEALRIWPDFVRAHVALGQLEWNSYATDSALEHMTRAFDLQLEEQGWQYRGEDPSPTGPTALLYYIAQIRVHGDAPDPAGQLAWLDGVAAKGYTSPALLQRRAEALVKLGRLDEAEQAYRASLAIHETFAARRSYGELLILQGRHDEARKWLDPEVGSITDPGERNELLIASGWTSLARDPAETLRIAEDLLTRRDSLSPEQLFYAKFLQGQAKLDLFDTDPGANPEVLEDVKKHLMSGIQAYPVRSEDSFVARMVLCEVMLRLHENEELVQLYQELLRYRDGTSLHIKLGIVHARLGQHAEALEQFRIAADAELGANGEYTDPDFLFEARRWMLREHRALEQDEAALAAIADWQARAPDGVDMIAVYLHASWLAVRGDLPGALEQARQVVTRFPDDRRGPDLVRMLERMAELRAEVDAGTAERAELEELARYHFGVDDFDGAKELLTRALALAEEPSARIDALQLMSLVLEEQNDLAGALEKADEALALDVPGLTSELRLRWKKRRDLLAVAVKT